MVSFTIDDLLVIMVGRFGEVGRKSSVLLTLEALNIEPKEMFERLKKLDKGEVQILSSTKCTVLANFKDQMLDISLFSVALGLTREEYVLRLMVETITKDLEQEPGVSLSGG